MVQVAVPLERNGDQLQDRDLQTDQQDKRATHHDALEFPNGEIVLLTTLVEGQQATVLQLPAAPEKPKEEPTVTRALDWADLIG